MNKNDASTRKHVEGHEKTGFILLPVLIAFFPRKLIGDIRNGITWEVLTGFG